MVRFVSVAPHSRTKIQGGGFGFTSRWVDLWVGMGGFRDQGVEMGRFRSM